MNIVITQHPVDPCGRLTVSCTESELVQLDLLFQAVMSRKHKEARYTSSTSFEAFFQLDPPITSSNQ